MSKKYAYWATKEGRKAKGDNADLEQAPKALLDEIFRIATPAENGGISFRDWNAINIQSALLGHVFLEEPSGEKIYEVDRNGIVQRGIHSAIKECQGKKFDPKIVLGKINHEAQLFFQKSPIEYRMLVSVAVNGREKYGTENIFGKNIEFLVSRPQWNTPSIAPHWSEPLTAHWEKTEYQWAIVQVTGRTFDQAIQSGCDTLDILRSLWIFQHQFREQTFSFGRPAQPIGKIARGPLILLYESTTDALAADTYWHLADYTGDRDICCPSDGWTGANKLQSWAMSFVEKHQFRDDVLALFIRYVRALDNQDHDVCFLQLWAILEKITDTVGLPYEKTIARTVAFSKERELSKGYLEYLRRRRNSYVHSGSSDSDGTTAVYRVKRFVDEHLVRLITNPLSAPSLAAYGECLDLPSSIEELAKRRNVFDRMIAYRMPKIEYEI